ncbi:uncharacterized protein LOC107273168 [Cephus cinctus]|uniref:Uncharacterized protein LOC107273168 n=1 Tax=Cephus cinctus TaxID=211228 RepID=A0AAJ7FSV3_CEPCN|nr:uncharacterized protein LOC107273168 [Cephus cinctus]XP_015606559.1 uncharacterized protein LOC107273168 [Cephus cinctus]
MWFDQQTVITLKQPDGLFKSEFGDNMILENFTTSYLTAPGDNYGSTMYKVEATIKNNKFSKSKMIHAVAKMVPAVDFLRKCFESERTFPKEIAMYKEVLPAYRILQQDAGVQEDDLFDGAPKFYGARLSLLGDEMVDEDAAILLENLSIDNYKIGNRITGMDLRHAKLVIQNLAKFHGLGIALKLKRPEFFEEMRNVGGSELINTTLFMYENIDSVCTELLGIPSVKQYTSSVRTTMEKSVKETYDLNEPFGTFIHDDLWTNNIMFCYNSMGVPEKVKFVDFQVFRYASPIRDLVFFILSSVVEDVIQSHFDELIDLYHQHLINTLEEVKCNIENYTRENFNLELRKNAPNKLIDTLFMFKAITKTKSEIQNSALVSPEEFLKLPGNEIFKKKVANTVLFYLARKWI